MGTTKASAAKADRLKTAHVQQTLELVGKIASTMSARGFLPAGPGSRAEWDEYTSALYSNHSETLHRFLIALDLHAPIISELAETKADLLKLKDHMAAVGRKVAARMEDAERQADVIEGLKALVETKDSKMAEAIGSLSAAEREIILQRNSIGDLEHQRYAANELVGVLRGQIAELHKKLENAATTLQPFGVEAEKATTYAQHQEALKAKYKEFWYRLMAIYGHRIPTKGELVTIGVPYDLWSEIMVARQATFDIRAPDHGKKIGCNDCNTGKEYPDAVPIDLYFRNGADGCEAKTGAEPKSNLVWFYPVIR